MTHHKTTLLSLLPALLLTISQAALGQPAPVVIKTYGQHIGGNIVYTHLISNNGNRNVLDIAIAKDTDYTGSDIMATKAVGELHAFPLGADTFNTNFNPAAISAPTDWTAEIIQIVDNGSFLQWYAPDYPQPSLQPGQTLRFSISVPKYDPAYLTGHFSAGYAESPRYYNGIMEKLDTIPPVLTVTLNPATITAAQRGLMIPVTATITVKDDYDPAPEIKLVSVLADDPANGSDIQGDAVDTDDRSFSVRAARFNPAIARTYQVIYSATDASGNTSTATVNLLVN
ncbi:MAG: hypothetical protein WBL62_02685 [Gallionella sp.]